MHEHHPTAKRLPTMVPREDIPPGQHAAYDHVLQRIADYSGKTPVSKARDLVDGKPYAQGYFEALTNAPRVHEGIRFASLIIMESQGEPGSFLPSDHEWIDLILGFDSGYWGLHAGHTPNAIATGVPIESLEAMRDGREHDLSDDERQVIEFTRAVRDGGMTDEIWAAMVDRLGAVRGAIELAFMVCVLIAHHRMMWALGVPAMTDDAWQAMLDDFRSGRRDVRAATQTYVGPSMNRGSKDY